MATRRLLETQRGVDGGSSENEVDIHGTLGLDWLSSVAFQIGRARRAALQAIVGDIGLQGLKKVWNDCEGNEKKKREETFGAFLSRLPKLGR
jgi:hypothetical protein